LLDCHDNWDCPLTFLVMVHQGLHFWGNVEFGAPPVCHILRDTTRESKIGENRKHVVIKKDVLQL
jgi:hypothetical protein